MKARDKNCTDSKKGPATALRDGRDKSAQGKKSRVGREEKKIERGEGKSEIRKEVRREEEVRRRDTRCKQWKRVHDVPLSSLVGSRLRFSFIISLFIFCSALLFPFLLISLSLVNIYMCIRSHIHSFLSISLSHPLPLTPLFFSFSSYLVLSLSLFPSHTSEKYSRGSRAAAAAAAAARYVRAREKEKEREKRRVRGRQER